MKNFLTLQPVETVLKHLERVVPGRQEEIPLTEAVGRVLAAPVYAPENLPGFDRSTVDGYAVRARDIFGAQEGSPALLECIGDCAMGTVPSLTLAEGQAVRVLTGGMLPQGADCVVMLEYVRDSGGSLIEVTKTQAPGDNMLLCDDDARKGQELLPQGRRLRPQEIGLLAAFGITRIPVYAAARVTIISTGDEVVPIDAVPPLGKIRDVNTYSLAALCRSAGADVCYGGLIGDDLRALQQAVQAALPTSDAILLSGGSSAGMRDHTVEVFTSLPHSELLTHGVAISPGKPFILAHAQRADGRDVCLIGLPGHVVSALVTAQIFVLPLIQRLHGQSETVPEAGVTARLTRSVASAQGRRDYIRVRLAETGDPACPYEACPIMKPSGLITGLCEAQGLVICPENREGLYAGESVTVHLLV